MGTIRFKDKLQLSSNILRDCPAVVDVTVGLIDETFLN